MSYQLPTQFLVPGQPVNVQLLHPQLVQALKVSNKSPYDIQYADFGVQGSDWIVAGTEYMLYGSVQNQGDIYLLAVNTTNISPANPGAVLITQFQIGEEIPKGSWPVSIPFQTVNTNSSVTTAQSIDNEGNVAGTSIIKSVVAGDGTNAAVSVNNDAVVVFGDTANPGSFTENGPSTFNGNLSLGSSAELFASIPSAQTLVTGGTISLPNGLIKKVTNSGVVTGAIMALGTNQRLLILYNVGTNSITMAASGSNCNRGSNLVIAPGNMTWMLFDSAVNQWYSMDAG